MLHLLLRNIQASALRIVTELCLPCRIFLVDHVVRPVYRLDGKETVHGFQRDAFGFGDEEVDERNRENHHGGEQVEHAASGGTHSVEHLRRKACDYEIPKPELQIGSASADVSAFGPPDRLLLTSCSRRRWPAQAAASVDRTSRC